MAHPKNAGAHMAIHILRHLTRVRGVARGKLTLPAVTAGPTRDHTRHHDPWTHRKCHFWSFIHHDAHHFVADDVAVSEARHVAVVDVEVAAADSGGRDADQHVPGLADHRTSYRLVAHVVDTVPGERVHRFRAAGEGARAASAHRVPAEDFVRQIDDGVLHGEFINLQSVKNDQL